MKKSEKFTKDVGSQANSQVMEMNLKLLIVWF